MKNLMLLVICIVLILPAFFSITALADAPQKVKVVANWAYVYEMADLTSEKLATVQFASEHELASPSPVLDSQNNSFFNIKFEDGSAYILANTVSLTATNSAIIPILRPNTNIKKAIPNVSLYLKNGDSFESYTEIPIDEYSVFRIIDGYRQTDEYTKIQTTFDNEIVTAYVKTYILEPFGMKRWLKILLIFASILLLVLITYLGIRTKRRRA